MSISPAAVSLAQDPVRAAVGVMAASLVFSAFGLVHMPVVLALILWVALGFVAAVPLAANAAVTLGHSLKTKNPANPFFRLRRSGVLRVLVCGVTGLGAAAILLLHLSQGGVAAWLGTLAGSLTVIAFMLRADGLSQWMNAPVHDAAALRRWAFVAGLAATALVSALLRLLLGLPDPISGPTAASALVAEALAAHRLFEGVMAWVSGYAEALGLLSPLFEALLAALALAMGGAAVSGLTIAALMPEREWTRAVSVASDAPDPPAPHGPALMAGAVLAGIVFLAGLGAETRLAAQEPEARPVAQVQIGVERIGMTLYPSGSHARISAGRAALAEQDTAAMEAMRALVDAGFDAMEEQIDPFLDGYYALSAEYWRIGVALSGWVSGDAEAAMEAHLAARLSTALDSETHLGALADRLDALGLAEARAVLQAEEAALGTQALTGVNPGRLRVVAEFPSFPPLPELRSLGMASRIEARVGGSVAIGTLGAVVAQRVITRLLRRGVLRLGARALLATVPLVGGVLALGTDAVALKIEERNNRADFRAEILAALEAQRAEMLELLDGAEGL